MKKKDFKYVLGVKPDGTPRDYISYSSYMLWKTNKEGYRDRYYRNKPNFETVETIFGKRIGEQVEKEDIASHPTLAKIPNYPVKEYGIEIEIDGLKVKGYIDQFDPTTLAFVEMKTGHRDWKGKAPWDSVKVRRHFQLPWYSMLISEKHGKAHPFCHLVWLETAFKRSELDFQGHKLVSITRELELTGVVEIYKRRIAKWERDRVKALILEAAEEIHEDYKNYEKNGNI